MPTPNRNSDDEFMAREIEYRGFTIKKTGSTAWDWHCTFDQNGTPRSRWGTIDEMKADCDLVADGIGLPAPQRGCA